MPSPSPSRTVVPNLGCGYLLCLLLGAGGLGLLHIAMSRFGERRQPEGWIAGAFGVSMCVAAVALIAPMQRAVAQAKERLRREQAKPNEPWTWDPRWTDPNGIAQAERRHGRALLIFAIAALMLSLPMGLAFQKELRRGNDLIWLGLLFPAVSMWILGVAANEAWRRRKYGTARFMPAEMPLALGGEVAGLVVVTRPIVANAAGRVSVDCWATHVVRRGGKRTQREEVVAHTERELPMTEWSTAAGESRVLVQLPLRGGQPTTMTRRDADNPTFEWRLRIEAPTEGTDFVAEFVLPVFDVRPASGGGERQPEAERQSVGHRSAAERAEIFRAAGIREEGQPGAVGETGLVWLTGQGRGLVATPLVMALVFAAIAVVLWFSPVPGIIAVFMGLFALLLALILKALWSGGGERVWVEGDAVCVQRGAHAVRRIARAELLRIESSRNVGVGAQQFYRVVARTRPANERHFPRRVEIASMTRGDEATAEAIAWLEERLTGAK